MRIVLICNDGEIVETEEARALPPPKYYMARIAPITVNPSGESLGPERRLPPQREFTLFEQVQDVMIYIEEAD